MEMRRMERDGVAILEVKGKVQVGESAQQFAAELRSLLADTTGPVLLDVSGIDYIDSTGIGELVGYLQKFTEAERRMALLRPHRRLMSLLEITGLDRFFKIYSDLDEAVRSLKGA